MFHFQCRGLVLCAFFVQRVVGEQFRVQNLFSELSASNFVCEICSAGCRQAISCAKFVQRVVGKQFCVQNLFSGLSASNFVCKICSASCRQAILCAKFVQRVVGKQFCVQNSVTRFSLSSSPPPRGCCRGGGGERISKTEVRPRGWGLFPPRLRRRICIYTTHCILIFLSLVK